jgi:hypothetical protein
MLRPVHSLWLCAGGAALFFGTVITFNLRRSAQQQAELGFEQAENRRFLTLQAENKRLVSEKPSEEERKRLETTHADAVSLRARLDELNKSKSEVGNNEPISKLAKNWVFAGRTTPDTAIESVLWAASRGDTDRLADLLGFAPELHAQAEGLFSKLPPAAQQEYGTPEKVVATLLAGSFPKNPQASQVFAERQYGDQDAAITMSVTHADGESRINLFRLHNTADGWKLLVPANVLTDFEKTLIGDQQQPPETNSP